MSSSGYGLIKALKDIATETQDTVIEFLDGWKGGDSTYYRFSVTQGLQLTKTDDKTPEDKVDTATNRYVADRDVRDRISECARILAKKPLNAAGIGMFFRLKRLSEMRRIVQFLSVFDREWTRGSEK